MAGAIAAGIALTSPGRVALDRDGDGIACEVCH
ncbi:excalibur calcium-binding domain-containing protein [Mycobacterium sp. E342]